MVEDAQFDQAGQANFDRSLNEKILMNKKDFRDIDQVFAQFISNREFSIHYEKLQSPEKVINE